MRGMTEQQESPFYTDLKITRYYLSSTRGYQNIICPVAVTVSLHALPIVNVGLF